MLKMKVQQLSFMLAWVSVLCLINANAQSLSIEQNSMSLIDNSMTESQSMSDAVTPSMTSEPMTMTSMDVVTATPSVSPRSSMSSSPTTSNSVLEMSSVPLSRTPSPTSSAMSVSTQATSSSQSMTSTTTTSVSSPTDSSTSPAPNTAVSTSAIPSSTPTTSILSQAGSSATVSSTFSMSSSESTATRSITDTQSSSAQIPAATSTPINPTPTPSSSAPAPPATSTALPTPTTIPANAKKFTFSFKITNRVCSTGIRENDKNDPAYKSLANEVLTAVINAFANDKTFLKAMVIGFQCGSVSPTVEVTKTQNATESASIELAAVSGQISNGSLAGLTTQSFSTSAAAVTPAPDLYIILKTKLSVRQFCNNIAIFKKNFAAILLTSNGESSIKMAQIVVFENNCNDNKKAFNEAAPKFYISQSATDASKLDTEITTRASMLLQQFIEDATDWRIGAGFSRKVRSSELAGSAKPKDDKLTELSRVLIGMGVTFAVLIIIILIILIVSWKRRKTDNAEYPAVTIENDAYAGDRQLETNTYASMNSGYANDEHETKVRIDQHDYEYPMAPVNENRTHVTQKDNYEELKSDKNVVSYDSPPMYEPLSAADEGAVRVQIEPEVQQTPITVTLVSKPAKPEPRELNLSGLSERKENDEAMRSEFESFEYNMPSSDVYPEAVKEKNRLMNVIPRPETRVILSSLYEPNSDYINANFVRDHHQKKQYILAQSPLKETVEDFWRMVYEQNVRVIVMATPLVQLGVEKCHQYWPADSVAKCYKDITVQLRKKELKPDFTITTMSLTCKDEVREVVLYRYMTWPEDNIPENVQSFVKFLLEARKTNEPHDQMLLVHCSNGVGISGSFVAIDIGIQCLQEKKGVDVYSIVKSLRRDRAGAVQVFGEYKFIYKALYEYAEHIGASGDSFANETDATSSM